MKPLTFTLLSAPQERLNLSHFIPEKLKGMSTKDIAKLQVGSSRHPSEIGDHFKITGSDASDIVFSGGSPRFDEIGANMALGRIRVEGDVGAKAGLKMSGGTLVLNGNTGHQCGSGMSEGRIEVSGNCGDSVGGSMPGEVQGMTGGVLIVRGRAGDRAGERMRRGIIAILKGCGDYAGLGMIAGTIVVKGRVGAMPGYLMKRGSILLDRRPSDLSPTFVDCGQVDMSFPALFDKYLVTAQILDKPLLGAKSVRYGCDTSVLGKGELMFRGAS